MKKKIKSECKVVSKKGPVSKRSFAPRIFAQFFKANVSLSQRKRKNQQKKWKNQHQENKKINF